MRRCGWCGRFLKNDTKPTYGRNLHGVLLGQYVCPECKPHWEDLARANERRLKAGSDD